MRTSRWCQALILLAALLPAAQAQPGPATAAPPPNVILIVADDLGAGWLGCEGRAGARTPNLDCLAADGVMFTRAYVAIPQCAPSRASILTGRFPHRAGVIDNSDTGLALGVPTFAARLSDAGYRCGLVGKWHNEDAIEPHEGILDRWVTLDRLSTFPRDKYLDPVLIVDGGSERPQRFLTDALTDHALRFLEESTADGRPFLLLLNYYAPHRPFTMHPGFPRKRNSAVLPRSIRDDLRAKPRVQREGAMHEWFRDRSAPDLRYDIASYQSMVAAMDANIGRIESFLESSGLADNTLMIFTSDNGLMLGEHQMLRKGAAMYEELVRVPLLIKGRGVLAPGRQCDALVSLVDLCPTILSAAGVAPPDALDGRDLGPLLRDQAAAIRDRVLLQYHETLATDEVEPVVGVVEGRYKFAHYLRTNETELYDLHADPLEMNDRSDDDALRDVRARLSAAANRLREEIERAGPARRGPEATEGEAGED